jgi:hypothetical protein
MAITDKTRKILWAKSGNRCAICRNVLVVESTERSSESVIGDECHIRSGAKNGPRYDSKYPCENIDELENLMLLCRVHHKMIDDQVETYTTELLISLKSNHEKWVDSRFSDEIKVEPIKVVRFKSEIPEHLPPIVSGQDLFNLASTCDGYYQRHSDNLNEEETEMVGGFLQDIRDWIDVAGDLEPIDKVRAVKALSDSIDLLDQHGFKVFAAKEKQQIRGGVNGPSNFYVLHVGVLRNGDPNIVSFEQLETMKKEKSNK